MPETSPNLEVLEASLGEAGLAPERHDAGSSPYLPLPDDFDQVLAAKSRNFRRQWKNSGNRLAREGEIRLRLAGRDVALDEAFDQLVRLHRNGWEGRGGGSFRTDAYVRFHRVLSRRLLDAGALCLALLEVSGRVVAARYDFVHARKMWCFQGGWLPELGHARVGLVVLGEVIRWAIEQGLEEYDFLSGEDAYKARWATAERTLVDLRAFSPGIKASAYRRALAWKARFSKT